MLKSIMWNIIDVSGVFKLINLINKILLILNIKFADSTIVLLSCIEVFHCYNSFSWPILSADWVEIFESINNPLSSMSL